LLWGIRAEPPQVKMAVMVSVPPLLVVLVPATDLSFVAHLPAFTLPAAAIAAGSSLCLFLNSHRALHDWVAGTRVVRV
jgi:hypothetical protein